MLAAAVALRQGPERGPGASLPAYLPYLSGQVGQACGTWVASQHARAALTCTGRSCAIQWPLSMMPSERSRQYLRLGSGRRDGPLPQVGELFFPLADRLPQ